MTAFTNHKKVFIWVAILLSFSLMERIQGQISTPLAFQYFNDGEWEKAAPLFLEIYQTNKARHYLNYYVRCLIELEDFQTAEKELRKAYRQSHDITIYVDLAYIFEAQQNRKKSEEFLEKPFKAFPRSIGDIKKLGASYTTYRKFDHALRVYEIGRSVLNMPDEFRMDVAYLYSIQHRNPEMLDEYLALLLTQPVYLNSVQNYLRSALTRDIDKNLLDLTQQKTLQYIQQFPGLSVFSELLIWVYIQKHDFDLAVDQAISLDIRSRASGMRTLGLARSARQAGDYKPALRAYEYIIEKGPGDTNTNRNVIRPGQNPYSQALVEKNQTLLAVYEESISSTRANFQSLYQSYQSSAILLVDPLQKASQIKDLAYLNAFYLSNPDSALIQIDSALSLSVGNRQLQADYMLDKADYLMIFGNPWEAIFLYARVDKENKNNPTGSLAKFRKAQLAYFTGDFNWALAQLNVLKGSSSKLIANDAFELSLLIRENQAADDTLRLALKAISRAEYLQFQKKIPESLIVLDSIINSDLASLVKDDALFMKAEILVNQGELTSAKSQFDEIIQNFKYEVWGHKALFRLAELLYDEGEFDKAGKLFEDLIVEFPNSFYNLDARKYLRIIRNKPTSDITQ